MNRREARTQAFLLLFQCEFQPEGKDELLEAFLSEYNAGDQADYIKDVVNGVIEKKEELDEKLSEFLKDWTIKSISNVSRAVLRLGAYEMIFRDDIPNVVSVNEAVTLAKKYEGEEAAPFVNGILGSLKERLG